MVPNPRCAVCGTLLSEKLAEEPPNETRRMGAVKYELHAICAYRLDEERAVTCGAGEHNWDPDLEHCERCGLAYGDWTE